MTARDVLVVALAAVAGLGLVYRAYRVTKGGPRWDAYGQAVLALGLVLVALAIDHGVIWSRWIAFGFAVLFSLVVMPVWVLGVLIPMRPAAIDYAFTAAYWVGLIVVGVAALIA